MALETSPPIRIPLRAEIVEELRIAWRGGPQARCTALAAVGSACCDDPALGPLLARLLGLELLAGGGREEAMSASMVRAAEIEEAAGWVLAASHTRHQLALLTNSGGRLDRLVRYYRESHSTLRRQRNERGVGLCLRSLGELALRADRPAELVRACWERSERAFGAQELPEAAGPPAWLALLEALEAELP